MKALYHHRTLGDGAEGIHIREIIDALRDQGHEVRVVAMVGEEAGKGQQKGKKQRKWQGIADLMPGHVYELAEIGYNFVAKRNCLAAAREFPPDFVYDRYNSYSIGAIQAARTLRVPAILEVNAPIAYERAAYGESNPIKFPGLAVRYERKICARADHIFVVSTPLKEFLMRERGVPAEKVTVLPNGANPESFRPDLDGSSVREQYKLGDGLVLGFVGVLRPWHGVDMLLKSTAALVGEGRDLRVLIVGDGPIEAELKQLAGELGIADRVAFTGRIPHKEMGKHVAAMDIAVSPRATFYASPMKILEYMAMGLPSIGPRMANIEDILTDGEEGMLFEADDESSLRSAVERLTRDRETAAEMGAKARRKVERELNWARNARAVVDVVEGLQEGK